MENDRARARSMAISYVLEHVVGNGLVELSEWKKWADEFYNYIVQDVHDKPQRVITSDQIILRKTLEEFAPVPEEAKKVLKEITTFTGKDGRTFSYEDFERVTPAVARIATQKLKKLLGKCPKNISKCKYFNSEKGTCKLLSRMCLYVEEIF